MPGPSCSRNTVIMLKVLSRSRGVSFSHMLTTFNGSRCVSRYSRAGSSLLINTRINTRVSAAVKCQRRRYSGLDCGKRRGSMSPCLLHTYHVGAIRISHPFPSQVMTFSSQGDRLTEQFEVKPFGQLEIKTGDLTNVCVVPLDPLEHPHQDKVIVTSSRGGLQSVKSTHKATDQVTVSAADGCTTQPEHVCTIHVPIKFDILAELSGERSVSLGRIESGTVDIKVGRGSCNLTHLQGGNININSDNGDVRCDSLLQGNSRITTAGRGMISVHRVQGLTFHAGTEAGDIQVKALYADESNISTKYGNVHLGSGHRLVAVNIAEEGNLKIDSLDGSLTASVQKGDIDVYITQHDNVHITAHTGNILLKLADSVNTQVKMKALEVTISEDFTSSQLTTTECQSGVTITGVLNGKNAEKSGHYDISVAQSRTLCLEALNGTINVECQDWLKSLNFGGLTDT